MPLERFTRSSGGESRGPKFSGTKERGSGIGGISPSGWEERGSGGVGVAIWSAARDGIAGAPFVLPSSSGRMGDPAAEVARFLGVITSAVVRAAHSEGLPEIEKYP